ncbi:MAG: hypothetical protein Q9194_000132, partial [Teloschistes cf. exilis]
MSMASPETSTTGQQPAEAAAADFAKAFEELAKYVTRLFSDSILPLLMLMLDLVFRGEKTASAMEDQLTALERKLDELLEGAEEKIERTLEGAEKRMEEAFEG